MTPLDTIIVILSGVLVIYVMAKEIKFGVKLNTLARDLERDRKAHAPVRESYDEWAGNAQSRPGDCGP